MKQISFGSIKIGETAKKHINDCLDTNWITMGPKVRLFEERWAKLFGYKHTHLLNSGTSSDIAALLALYEMGARKGDKILIPGLSFIATANAVRAAGFTPVFVDVELETMNIDVKQIENVITDRTIAIMPVNLMGKPAKLEAIKEIASSHKMWVVVDNCEAYGAKRLGKYSLEYADMETTSHFIAHICMMGEGGTVSTNHEGLDRVVEAVRSHGRLGGSSYFDHPVYGLNFKNTDLHASIGLEGIEQFEENFAARTVRVNWFKERLKPLKEFAWFVEEDEGDTNAPHAFSLTLKDPKFNILKLQKKLTDSNVQWKRNFGAMYDHGCMRYVSYIRGPGDNARYIGNNGIHWGVHRDLTQQDVNFVSDLVLEYFEEREWEKYSVVTLSGEKST